MSDFDATAEWVQMDAIGSGWEYKAPPCRDHVCDLPPAPADRVAAGSIWRCECGQRWELRRPAQRGDIPGYGVDGMKYGPDGATWVRLRWWQRPLRWLR